ncbi:MAG: GYD domain-containing protein [Chloroflexi bacterium]|nr:GYD domain-containing protein [Chloroflexota bacterium]
MDADQTKKVNTYIMFSKLTERGRDRVRTHPERILEVNHEVEMRGCNVVAQYAMMGDHDFVTIIEAPDNGEMSRIAIELGARGTIDTTTYAAIPIEKFIEIMQMSDS